MKTVRKQLHQDDQAIGNLFRRLFELQIELETKNNHVHDYTKEFQNIIESLDGLFEKAMHQSAHF